MPAKTEKQRKFMAMCATPAGRKKAHADCPPIKIAKEFRHAKEGK